MARAAASGQPSNKPVQTASGTAASGGARPQRSAIVTEEIAALAAFLLSPDAAAITGQDIAACGGASLPH